MYAMCLPDALGGQKKALDSIDLELMAVSHRKGAELGPWRREGSA